MKLLKVYIIFVIVSLIVGVGNAFNTSLEDFKLPENIVEESDIETEKIKEENHEVVTEKKHEEIKEQGIIKENTIPTQKEVKSNDNNKKLNNNTSSVSKKEEVKETKQEEKIVHKETAWEKLGLTEDEYYNKPIMKWQKVTHSSMEECKNAGNKSIENDEYESFWCYEVYSPSGKFLGTMLSLS